MSELDGMSPMDREQFKRKWYDTHTELKLGSAMFGANAVKKSPGDRNAANVSKLKKPIEKFYMDKQRENMVELLSDAFGIRAKEVLNKNEFSQIFFFR